MAFHHEVYTHNLSAILSCGRQFEASYIKYVPRNWRAQSFHDAGLPRQYSMGANFRKFRSKTFGPTGKVSKKRFRLMRWATFPGRIGWNFVWMDSAPWFKNILSHWLWKLLGCCCCFFRIPRQSRTQSLRLTDQKSPRQADGGGRTKGQTTFVASCDCCRRFSQWRHQIVKSK